MKVIYFKGVKFAIRGNRTDIIYYCEQCNDQSGLFRKLIWKIL